MVEDSLMILTWLHNEETPYNSKQRVNIYVLKGNRDFFIFYLIIFPGKVNVRLALFILKIHILAKAYLVAHGMQ